jgi:two-component system, OmpR family, KDP operon response regulator KdpE
VDNEVMRQTEKPVILVVDDEPEILRALRAGLAAQGYEILAATNGEEGLALATSKSPDLVILDMMLPGEIDGLEVCRRLRQWSDIPILMLSALGHERQKVAALDIGADDYLTKPFGMSELTARVRAALRRVRKQPQAAEQETFEAGDMVIDYFRRIVTRQGDEVRLTPYEFEILKFLSQHADRVITHRHLLGQVWGPEYVEDTQTLRVHIGHLRRKIEPNPSRPTLIITEPGVGYRLKSAD